MKRFLHTAAAVPLALLLVSASGRFEPAPAPDFAQRLDAAVAEGRIDAAHATLYRLFALRAPEKLPAELRSDVPVDPAAHRAAAGGAPVRRCGTSDLRAVRVGLAALPADLRAEALALLAPPGARTAASVAPSGKAVSHRLPNWVTTANFSLEWGPDLTNEDGSRPVRDANANGIPDVVERWAAYFEASYRYEVEKGGFTVPKLSTDLVPIYLGNSSASTAVDNISSGTYSLTYDDTPTGYIVVNNDFSFAPANEDPEGDITGAMKVTAAHEFFHVLQFLIKPPDTGSGGVWDQEKDDWWLEASATWMEDEVFDEVNDYWQYFEGPHGWASFARLPLAATYHEYVALPSRGYGAAIFGKYLSEHVGGSDAVVAVWRDSIAPVAGTPGTPGMRPLDALGAFARAQGFSDGLGGLFQGFAAANAVMDYRDGSRYGTVEKRETATFTASGPPVPGGPQGAVYLQRTGAQSGAPLSFALTGSPAASWGLAAALRRGSSYTLALGATSAVGTPSLALSGVGAGDTLYAAVSFLAGDAVTGYSVAESAGSPDPTPPAAPTGLSAAATPAGLDLSWTGVTGAAGYVVRWRPASPPGGSDTWRTLHGGDVTRVELRGLAASTRHDVAVFAYGLSGTEGTAATAAETTGAASPTPTPTPAMMLHTESTGGGGGGGGGGGCFLSALGW